ncbi:BLUF domain-containing protein [Psychrobacter sp. DAB_AL43B]|uniref:BLUF domain-containing protein n=1 Tax=Psychrobacter sp. DAB_AL43B TaxID=1028416 RepID=UPI0009A8CA71|nr:BLUF domain-containing protein [Psychrobacter sp. DAB_AL43B]SLJ85277.1 hypothetical protein DABAL43B_2089 [Psychrobacter sp. DAB_AL43B]
MKCIAYVSEVPLTNGGVRLPVGLSGIVRASNRNKASDITGFLCYRHGYYIQVIEGPDREVSQLASKIEVDSRHENFRVFINKRISERCFPDWRVNVFDFIDQSPLFKQFITGYRAEIANLTEAQKLPIQYFHDLSSIPDSDHSNINSSQSYEGKNLRLLAWPDFNLINQSQMIIDLCVKLTKQPYSFDQLLDDDQLGTREHIITTLEKFDALGILKVTESELLKEPEQPKEQKPETQTKKPSSFYGAIKKFLGMR